MDDITRKQMKDVVVPQNDIVRRPQTVPEPYVAPFQKEEEGRIERNPFFEKRLKKSSEPLKKIDQDKVSPSRALPLAFLIFVLLVGGFAVANYFSRATVEVVPISRNINLDNDFFATTFNGAGEGELVYNFATSTEEKSKDISATIEKKIQKKASGKVIIFNAYNGDSQRLIKNTRLESADHKIFRIDQSVVVPGAKVVDGKTVPGSVNVVVYADVAGEAYNIKEPTDFTIPGFKGDPRYTKFKAMTVPGSPISGGSSGPVKVPTDEVVAGAREELKKDITKIAVEKARAQIPDNMSLFPGSIIIKFEEVPQEFTNEDTARVTMRATVSVFFFDTTLLTKKIAETVLPDDKGHLFTIPKLSMLEFKFVDPVDNIVLSDLSKIHFHINGPAEFVGQVDTAKIREALVGKNKKDFSAIIVEQSNIYKADAVIRPMWKTVFPSDASKINVKIITK